jgi:hypothetical protein
LAGAVSIVSLGDTGQMVAGIQVQEAPGGDQVLKEDHGLGATSRQQERQFSAPS